LLSFGQRHKLAACKGTAAQFFRALVVGAQDADGAANGLGRRLVVSCNHDHADPRLGARLDGPAHFGARGVVQACEAQKTEAGLDLGGGARVAELLVSGVVRGAIKGGERRREVLAARERNQAERLAGGLGGGSVEGGAQSGGEGDDAAGGEEGGVAAVEHALVGALDEQDVAAAAAGAGAAAAGASAAARRSAAAGPQRPDALRQPAQAAGKAVGVAVRLFLLLLLLLLLAALAVLGRRRLRCRDGRSGRRRHLACASSSSHRRQGRRVGVQAAADDAARLAVAVKLEQGQAAQPARVPPAHGLGQRRARLALEQRRGGGAGVAPLAAAGWWQAHLFGQHAQGRLGRRAHRAEVAALLVPLDRRLAARGADLGRRRERGVGGHREGGVLLVMVVVLLLQGRHGARRRVVGGARDLELADERRRGRG
jgi:hypothetical protein